MVAILSALASIFEFRVRSRSSLELELIALRHQVAVLRRQRPGRPYSGSRPRDIAASNGIKPLELLACVEESHERGAMESRLGTRRLSPTL
jgi:hypothetical protein